MSDLEARLRALGAAGGAGRAGGNGGPSLPDVDPLLRRAHRRRQAKLVATSATVLTAVVLLSVGLFSRDDAHESRVVSTPDGTEATTTTWMPAVVAGEDDVAMSSTTTPARPGVATPPTTAGSEPPPPTSTTTPPPTTTTTPRPAAQVAEPGLWLVGLDGSGLHRVGNKTPSFYAWSPDGRYLAMSSREGNLPPGIDIVSSNDGSIVTTIPASDWIECLDWSSTGRLAWRHDDGSLYIATITASGQVDATGTRRSATATQPGWSGSWDMNCRWSPDGTILATAGAERLFTFTADGARRSEFIELSGTQLGGITWGPDGYAIAAVARTNGRPHHVAILRGANHGVARHVEFDALRAVFSNDPAVLYLRSEGELAKVSPSGGRATVEASIDDVAGLTPLPDSRWLHITKGQSGDAASDLRFFEPGWQRGHSLLVAKPRNTTCDGTYFGSVRVSPDGRRAAVQVLSWGGAAAAPSCATRLPT